MSEITNQIESMSVCIYTREGYVTGLYVGGNLHNYLGRYTPQNSFRIYEKYLGRIGALNVSFILPVEVLIQKVFRW